MTMEDLAECQAEVIQPIKYEYKAKEGQDGVSLWEVGIRSLKNGSPLMIVSTKWTGSNCAGSPRYH